ncbi:hypothetical protein [Thiogranum longum]|nr:hypothetical protein [Thiogranum longum]
MAKVKAVSAVTRDKVDNPDPWMELDSDCAFSLKAHSKSNSFIVV